ncbi:hypothetical protein ABIF69_000180 [Bradyrhizobium japonicum]
MTIYSFPSGTATPEASPSKSRPQSQRKPRSITGRDEYIVAEALYRYIATEQAKPDHEQSWSNLQDCRCLFLALCGNAAFFADHYPGVTISLVDEKAPRELSE